ncbi:chromosome partitioning protein [Candidatus Poribacteria bacterium]|nr:MAG: chromosome partitioning protein [Candidatus Poribacteria bacterium]
MPIPVLTFFNNKGGVGKTSLVYHLAWMLSDLGYRVLACDLDPQANLTAAFLDELFLEKLWGDKATHASAKTIMQCVQPLMRVHDLQSPQIAEIAPTLRLIPGDLALAGFEDTLSVEWPIALGSTDLYRAFRVLTAFSTVMQDGAKEMDASIILADVGPNLGAINRSALIATDYIIVPLGADLFSLQGLRNLGPTLNKWRNDWNQRKEHWKEPEFPLPNGDMKPVGYVVQQHGVRLDRPVKAYDKWVNRMPAEYARNLLDDHEGPYAENPAADKKNALATVKHYRSLVPMAQEARKPIFHLKPADGAIGAHATAASSASLDFKILAKTIIDRIGIGEVF